MGSPAEEGHDVPDKSTRVEVDRVELELAGLHLGEVEQVVDDAEQRVGRGPDNLEILALIGVEIRLQGQLRHAEDGVHGGTDLMADVGQELALGLAGGLRHLLGQPVAPLPVVYAEMSWRIAMAYAGSPAASRCNETEASIQMSDPSLLIYRFSIE